MGKLDRLISYLKKDTVINAIILKRCYWLDGIGKMYFDKDILMG